MKTSIRWVLIIALATFGVFLVIRKSGNKPDSTGARPVAFHAGKTESRNSMTSSTSSSSSDNARFNARHVLFLTNNHPHPLSRRIHSLASSGLKDSALIDSIETPPPTPSQKNEWPDLFLRIDLVELKEDGVLSRSLKAVVTASLGTAPWQSHHFTQSSSTPPLVQFHWNATLDHESTFTGIRSDRYEDAARSIADELIKGITNQFKELAKKHPPLPPLPPEFHGPYEPAGDFPFLKELTAQPAFSYAGLFTHNETFWKFQAKTNPIPQLQRIIDQLAADSWKVDSSNLTNTQDYYLRFQQKDAELEIFRLRPERMDPARLGKVDSALDFIVHYRKRFSDPEREAVLEKLFTTHAVLETLLPFQNSFSNSQRDRYYAMLEKSPASSPRAYLQLADLYLRRKDTNAAVKVLLRVKALQGTIEGSGIESEIETTAKKISPGEKLKLEVTPEIFRDLGFLELTDAPQTFKVERAFGQPVLLFTDTERGPQTFCLRISPPRNGNYPWAMIETMEHGRSSTSSQFTLRPDGDWQQTFTFGSRTLKFTVHLTPDGKSFRYSIESRGTGLP